MNPPCLFNISLQTGASEKAVVVVDSSRNEVSIPGAASPFTFDAVFGSDSTQQSVYDSCAASVVGGCLEGYNGTIFAYGQTVRGDVASVSTPLPPISLMNNPS